MPAEQPASKPAKILYLPVGLTSSIIGGVVAGQLFKQVWKRASPTNSPDAPKALESEYSWPQILAAAAAQGAVFATVKAAIQRGGARAFQRATGEWPGD
ncbi:DUF4235 domain-containing protein [Nocardioides sp. MH1]|uniref:DUF4235 domain-containing protein n=1 Tax=Nocardioides sp. MH1 TaxID=3242490 RepID=UPI00351FED39